MQRNPKESRPKTEGLKRRIILNKEILAGKPIIKGTRIPVYLILELLASGMDESEVISEYPQLTTKDIKAALAYASNVIREEEIIPISRS